MCFRSLAIVWGIVTSLSASTLRADVVISFSDPSVSISVADAQNVTITGNTIGDMVVPFLITASTVSTTQQVSLAGPLGSDPFPLNLNLPATRNASTLMTVSISVPGYQMVDPSFTLLDVDASASVNPPFSGWQDQVTFLDPAANYSFAPVDPSRFSIVGNQITAVSGPNIGNNSTLANVLVSLTGNASSIAYDYGPGGFDLLGQNQRHGISSITMTRLTSVPEPGCAVAIPACMLVLSMRRTRKRVRSRLGEHKD